VRSWSRATLRAWRGVGVGRGPETVVSDSVGEVAVAD